MIHSENKVLKNGRRRVITVDGKAHCEFHNQTDAVSWKHSAECPRGAFQHLRTLSNSGRGNMTFTVGESYQTEKNKHVSREVMITLDRDELCALKNAIDCALERS